MFGVVLLAGLIATVPLAANIAGGSLWPSAPAFEAQPAPNEDPFSLHVSVRNPSAVFALNDLVLACDLPRFVTRVATSINLKASARSQPVTLQPLETIHYQCPANRNIRIGVAPVVYVTAIVNANFSSIGISRAVKSEMFHWDADKKQWLRGALKAG